MSGSGGRLPYPGMRAFRRDEADLFFGREGHVDAMVDRLTATRFLAVLGPSGGGKSSLVRTGLLDALELGFSDAGAAWCIADMHPGSEPVRNLARALLGSCGCAVDAVDVDVLADRFMRGPRAVVEWVAKGNLAEGHNLLILVDQFEELFRYGDYAGREEAEAFVKILLETAQAPDVPIYVCITMRSEYLGACALIPGLAETINQGLYLTPRLTREQCKAAIEGPAGVCGFDVEPALTNKILNDMADMAPWSDGPGENHLQRLSQRADQLPLMQHVLNRMWLTKAALQKKRERLMLSRADYDALGGLKGALDAHGDEILDSFGPSGRAVAARLFRALTGGTSIETAVRRPCRVRELIADQGGAREDVMAVIEAFRAPNANFLQPPHPQSISDDTLIDISHESLIRQWSTLTRWFQAEAQSAATWRELLSDTHKYREARADLLTGLELTQASLWWEQEQPTAEWADRHGGEYDQVRAFLEASQARRDSEKEAERRKGLQERKWLRIQLAASVAALVTVAGLGVFAYGNYWTADRAREEAVNLAMNLDRERSRLAEEQRRTELGRQIARQEAQARAVETRRAEEQSQLARRRQQEAETARTAAEEARRRAAEGETRARESEERLEGQIRDIGEILSRRDTSFNVSSREVRRQIYWALHNREPETLAEGDTSTMRRQLVPVLAGYFDSLSANGAMVSDRDRLENYYTRYRMYLRDGSVGPAADALVEAWDLARELEDRAGAEDASLSDQLLVARIAYEMALRGDLWDETQRAEAAREWLQRFAARHESDAAEDPELALALANYEALEAEHQARHVLPPDFATARRHAERAEAQALRAWNGARGRTDPSVQPGEYRDRYADLLYSRARLLQGPEFVASVERLCSVAEAFLRDEPQDERAIQNFARCARGRMLAQPMDATPAQAVLDQTAKALELDPTNPFVMLIRAQAASRAIAVECGGPNPDAVSCHELGRLAEETWSRVLSRDFILDPEENIIQAVFALQSAGGPAQGEADRRSKFETALARLLLDRIRQRVGRPRGRAFEIAFTRALWMSGLAAAGSAKAEGELDVVRQAVHANRRRSPSIYDRPLEEARDQCGLEGLLLGAEVAAADMPAAVATFHSLEARCEKRLARHPWDIFLRQALAYSYGHLRERREPEFQRAHSFLAAHGGPSMRLTMSFLGLGMATPTITPLDFPASVKGGRPFTDDLLRTAEAASVIVGPPSVIPFLRAVEAAARRTDRPAAGIAERALARARPADKPDSGAATTAEELERLYASAIGFVDEAAASLPVSEDAPAADPAPVTAPEGP